MRNCVGLTILQLICDDEAINSVTMKNKDLFDRTDILGGGRPTNFRESGVTDRDRRGRRTHRQSDH
jgi:hypothetical protein